MSETLTLAPFNAEATCPKCGHDTVKALYRRSACWSGSECPVDWHAPIEHLDRVCQRCFYRWAEAVLS